MSICDNIFNAINNQSYGFDLDYFLNALNTLNTSNISMGGAGVADMRLILADSLILSGNKILNYIGTLVRYSIFAQAAQAVPQPPPEIIYLANDIIIDNHHDFSVDSRCSPKITKCLAAPQPPLDIINAKTRFQEIRNYYNIHNMDTYNLNASFFIEDTNSTTIKTKMNLSGNPKKMNLIANILDSAGCKFCNDPHNFNSIPLELELYILNLGFIFYQSYFKKLSSQRYYVYFMISLIDYGKQTKETFSDNKNFWLNLYIYDKNVPINVNNPKIKQFLLSNNRNFSVANICKTLNSKTLSGLSKELNEYFINELKGISKPERNDILTTFYISGKGLGDFSQVFSVACLYYYNDNENIFKGNCILTTIDTFLFIIAILLGCPIIIGTANFEYISIDDFLKYKGESIITAHNKYSDPQIYIEADAAEGDEVMGGKKKELIEELNSNIEALRKCCNSDKVVPFKISEDAAIADNFIGMALNPLQFVFKDDTPPQEESKKTPKNSKTSKKSSKKPLKNTQSRPASTTISLTPQLASSLFNIYTKISSNYCKELNKKIYIHCYYDDSQEQEKKVCKYVLKKKNADDSITTLLTYDDYFNNNAHDIEYKDGDEGKALLKTVMSYTVYTQYFNFMNFINYIYSNYYSANLGRTDTFLKIILESLANKGEKQIEPKQIGENIFFALSELLNTANGVKAVNEKYYEMSKPNKNGKPEFLKRMAIEFKKESGSIYSQEFNAVKDDILLPWNIRGDLARINTRSFLTTLKQVLAFINSCTYRYSVLYTFIGDIHSVINNIEYIVSIITDTIVDIQGGNNSLENLKTLIDLFDLYKNYLLSSYFKEVLDILESIMKSDINAIDNIIRQSWNVCDVKDNFRKLIDTEEEGNKKRKVSEIPINIQDAEGMKAIKNYAFKSSVIIADTLDEADKIYKKWAKLVLPDTNEIKSHPIAKDFWSNLEAFRHLNCKFASLKSYCEQYTILDNDIKMIKLIHIQLEPLLNAPDLPITPDNLERVKDKFIPIYLIFKAIKDGITIKQQEPQPQQPQQPPQQPLQPPQQPQQPPQQPPQIPSFEISFPQPQLFGTSTNQGGSSLLKRVKKPSKKSSKIQKKKQRQTGGLSNDEITGYYRRNPIERDTAIRIQRQINDIVNIVVEKEKNAEEYYDTNINIGEECSANPCYNNKCDPKKDASCFEATAEAGIDVEFEEAAEAAEAAEAGADIREGIGIGRRNSRGVRRVSSVSGVSRARDAMQEEASGVNLLSSGTQDEIMESDVTQPGITNKKRKDVEQSGGAFKLKEGNNNKKIILGKERRIYTKKGSKKEYVKYKREYLTIKEIIKLKSIAKPATPATPATPKKTPATPATPATQATPKKTPTTPATAKKISNNKEKSRK